MNRYLGTKTKILPELHNAISNLGGISRVCDIFAGSLSVSLSLKRKGYSVIANDVNDLSYAYARAYLTCESLPQLNIPRLVPRLGRTSLAALRVGATRLLGGQRKRFDQENTYGEFRSWNDYSQEMSSLALLLAFLQWSTAPSSTLVQLRTDVVDHYTRAGRFAHYRSVRGSRGKRNYFSTPNARRLDFILSHIRHWYRAGLLDDQSKFTLLSVLLDSMERCVNSQGTYHDFPRDRLEERARKGIRLALPNYFGLLHSDKKHWAGRGDSLEFIAAAPRHDALYIDPPYNFRQYTAYYHLPNFFVRYPDIDELDGYLSQLAFVRGQNMSHDFASPFSNREMFLPALKSLVSRAKCRYVVLSYFDGVNHWNRFLAQDNSRGYRLLKSFFRSSIFEPDSTRVIPIERTNYQSQNGHRAKQITEYLFVGQKRVQR